ncbi:DUF6233 domain-containing protein [Streptomyces cyaneofuscatus]|uniref:DUF6233 domain-containing protein n=1 Tax=Streptomyces cyaneofuscatus TaxID=66883 RepID=UPI003828638A
MSEEPSRLEMLHFARRIAVQNLAQIDKWIAAEEQREADRAAGASQRAAAEPQWTIGLSTNGAPEEVHAPGCSMAGQRQQRTATVDQAREALVQGVQACEFCRPDTELGF